VMGIWLIAAPFILGFYAHGVATANDILIGLVTIFLALATTLAPGSFRSLVWWNSYVGFWLIVAPFILGYLSYQFPKSGAVPMWNDMISGTLIWFFSFVKAMSAEPSGKYFP
jgi:hypothetical protein